MRYMFYGCRKITELKLGDWNTFNVTDMFGSFGWCDKLTELDLSSFDTTNATDMTQMFTGSQNINTTLTIRNSSTIYNGMFVGDTATAEGSQITLNYTNATSSLVDDMIASKPSNSNVVKGSLVA